MIRERLEELFTNRKIDFQQPGFYDSPGFLAAEREDRKFLENYAEYVNRREYSTGYLEQVRRVVPRLASFVYRNLQQEGTLGACIDVSNMVSRMLDHEGIWSYAVGGGVTVRFPEGSGLEPSHFGVLGGASKIAAHMWIRVPPFAVLDITLPEQPWDPRRKAYFHTFVISEIGRASGASVEQLMDMDEIERFAVSHRRLPNMTDIERRAPHIIAFMERFPSFAVEQTPLIVEYAPTKIGASIEPLAEMQVPSMNGLLPWRLYEQFKTENTDT